MCVIYDIYTIYTNDYLCHLYYMIFHCVTRLVFVIIE